MKIRQGFVSNSSSSSFIVHGDKIKDIQAATNYHTNFEVLKDKDKKSVLEGIIKRAEDDIVDGWDIEANKKKIDHAKKMLDSNNTLYITDMISDGYWTEELFFDDPDVVEYFQSSCQPENTVEYGDGNVEILKSDCASNKLDLSKLCTKDRKLIIELYDRLKIEDEEEE